MTISTRSRRTLHLGLVALGLVGLLHGCDKSAPTNPFDRVDGSLDYDAGQEEDAGTPTRRDAGIFDPFRDSGVLDAGSSTPDGGTVATPMGLNDLVPCNTSVDCPATLGAGVDCITEVPLSHPDAMGQTAIPITAVFPGLSVGGTSYVGVCTATCTFTEDTCANVSLAGPGGTQLPFTCRMITQGRSPYPYPAPAFPFTLESDKMEQGHAFGAICLPPPEADPTTNPGLCGACDGTTGCSSGTCWDFLNERPVTGVEPGICLPSCDAGHPCPLGYDCADLDDAMGAPLGSFCRPITDTCTSCQDVDHDGRGVGRCTSTGTRISQVDCDDRNAAAYYDSTDMLHPFATGYCGDTDYNCNGENDQGEIIALPAAYGANHCGACNASCTGRVPAGAENGTRTCVPATGGAGEATGRCVAVCDDPVNEADCDDDPDTGCEYTAATGATFYYGDGDGDGAGSSSKQQVACGAVVPPSCGGAVCVPNSVDCNDGDPNVFGNYGGPATPRDICNGNVDDDCDSALEEDAVGYACNVPGALPNCMAGAVASCSAGTPTCVTTYATTGEICNNGLDDDCDGAYDNGWIPGQVEVQCNNRDDNCDGTVDELVRAGKPNAVLGGPCTVDDDTYTDNDSVVGACRAGTWTCGAGQGWRCAPNAPTGEARGFDAVDSNCDGHDLNTSGSPQTGAFAIFVKGNVSGSTGSYSSPFATLSAARNYAANWPTTRPSGWSASAPVDIYFSNAGGEILEQTEIALVANVSIYGGLDAQFRPPGALGAQGAYTCSSRSVWKRVTPLASLISANNRNNVAMRAATIGTNAPVLLRCLEITASINIGGTAIPQNAPGFSNYAFHCTNCSGVTFDQVSLTAGDGTVGGAGQAGAAGNTAPAGVAGAAQSGGNTSPNTSDWCPNTTTAHNYGGYGGAGLGGVAEANGVSGTYCIVTDFINTPGPISGSGSTGGAAGTLAAPGAYNAPGNGGGGSGGGGGMIGGSLTTSVVGGFWTATWPPAGSLAYGGDGGHGSGGGGGSAIYPMSGSSSTCRGDISGGDSSPTCCYYSFNGGCPASLAGGSGAGGGCLGTGGWPGYPGGHSIALYVDNSGVGGQLPTVTYVSNVSTLSLSRGSGGTGGAGGAGANGSAGGGTSGAAYGGAGGGGGGGGGGAGGPGGHSYCIVYAATSNPKLQNITCNSLTAVAAGGPGGMPGMAGNGGMRGDNVTAGNGTGGTMGATGWSGRTCSSNDPAVTCP